MGKKKLFKGFCFFQRAKRAKRGAPPKKKERRPPAGAKGAFSPRKKTQTQNQKKAGLCKKGPQTGAKTLFFLPSRPSPGPRNYRPPQKKKLYFSFPPFFFFWLIFQGDLKKTPKKGPTPNQGNTPPSPRFGEKSCIFLLKGFFQGGGGGGLFS